MTGEARNFVLPPEATEVQSASPELASPAPASEAPVPPVTPNAVEEAAGDARGDAKGDATEALGIIESQGARQGKNPLGWYEWYVFFG